MSDHDFAADRRAVSAFLPPPWGAPAGLLARRLSGDAAIDRVTCRLGDGACASAHAARVRQSGGGASGSTLHRSLLRLQREYGNRYVGQMMRQASGDGAEAGGMDAVERSIDQARGSGNGMDHATRSRMDSAFGADFSGVRIHTDARADDLSQSLAARAFTTGRDVFFRQGEYSPGTSSGRELLAHELTHVVQQGGAAVGVQPKMTVSDPGDPQEVEADEMARAVMRQEHASTTEDNDEMLQTKPGPVSITPFVPRQINGITRREDGGGEETIDAGAPDWSAPIEQEADIRSEQRHANQTVPELRAQSGSITLQCQAAPPAAPAAPFPTFPQVRWNATVSNAMWSAWAETLRAATTTTRREQGFWVQWDNTTTRNATGSMRITGAVTGSSCGPTTTASVILGARPADAGNWVTVASFHTHTPTRFRPVGRVVGPSSADHAVDTSDNVTGLVYDYTAVAGGAVPAGHPIWSPAQVYHSGPNSRV